MIESRIEPTMALRCRAVPTPDKYFASAAASAFLTSSTFSPSARSYAAFL